MPLQSGRATETRRNSRPCCDRGRWHTRLVPPSAAVVRSYETERTPRAAQGRSGSATEAISRAADRSPSSRGKLRRKWLKCEPLKPVCVYDRLELSRPRCCGRSECLFAVVCAHDLDWLARNQPVMPISSP